MDLEGSSSEDEKLQGENLDLKRAANETRSIILELSLDGYVRWVSPSWQEIIGYVSTASYEHF
jgi:serine/threonine-protein kinase RIM15